MNIIVTQGCPPTKIILNIKCMVTPQASIVFLKELSHLLHETDVEIHQTSGQTLRPFLIYAASITMHEHTAT